MPCSSFLLLLLYFLPSLSQMDGWLINIIRYNVSASFGCLFTTGLHFPQVCKIHHLVTVNVYYTKLCQAMRFGDLPKWALELSKLVHSAVCTGHIKTGSDMNLSSENPQNEPLPFELLWREPLFDQLIANVYKPGEVCLIYHPSFLHIFQHIACPSFSLLFYSSWIIKDKAVECWTLSWGMIVQLNND